MLPSDLIFITNISGGTEIGKQEEGKGVAYTSLLLDILLFLCD